MLVGRDGHTKPILLIQSETSFLLHKESSSLEKRFQSSGDLLFHIAECVASSKISLYFFSLSCYSIFTLELIFSFTLIIKKSGSKVRGIQVMWWCLVNCNYKAVKCTYCFSLFRVSKLVITVLILPTTQKDSQGTPNSVDSFFNM